MSPRQPVVNAKQLVRILEKKGFVFARQNGSHAIYINDQNLRVTVPLHGKKDIGSGLLRQILSDVSITFEELRNML